MKCIKSHCLGLPLSLSFRFPFQLASPPSLFSFACPKPKTYFLAPRLSFSTPRRSRRSRRSRFTTNTNSDNFNDNLSLRRTIDLDTSSHSQNIKLVIDFHQISSLSSDAFNSLLSFSNEAIQDLQHSILFDPQTRTLQLSCRKSTLQFLAGLLTCAFLLTFALRVLVKLGFALKSRFLSPTKQKVIVRRDRSLGGREVIVAVGTNRNGGNHSSAFRALDNPLSTSTSTVNYSNYSRHQVGNKLPKWWPQLDSLPKDSSSVANSEYYQTQANRLIREIIDNRLGGKDITEEDIIQLRRICRVSGIKVSIDTTNTRDSFYRASIELVLNVCCRAPSQSNSVQIEDEDARQFLAGLAENIGLDKFRAVRMVSAGVAARTRLCFLQAWAFEMQGKRTEAVLELSKICLVHRIFPPEESSPEMEMVARGLEKLLKVEQRELLMDMLVGVCNGESRRSAAEALGLAR